MPVAAGSRSWVGFMAWTPMGCEAIMYCSLSGAKPNGGFASMGGGSLHFKLVEPYGSARVDCVHRALGVENDGMIGWFS